MFYVTGDTHGDFRKLGKRHVPATYGDYVIICGDMGLLWDKDKTLDYNLKWLSNVKYTLLWVQGNHENYDMIEEYPVTTWHGGKVRQIIKDKVILLERGQVFDIDGKTFFTFGGASSHDISDGILDPQSFESEAEYKAELKLWKKTKTYFRVKGESWWEQELPTDEEMQEGLKNLTTHKNRVDYIITHCCSSECEEMLDIKNHDKLTDYFNYIEKFVDFKQWYFGHYHEDITCSDNKHILCYHNFYQLEEKEKDLSQDNDLDELER